VWQKQTEDDIHGGNGRIGDNKCQNNDLTVAGRTRRIVDHRAEKFSSRRFDYP